ncbi:Scramblase-domain-containing protein [Syncephalastrum racemosum]|uniref:Phospholipid scramblase n=1 Tax=Syncephalastrum racemosum TaxID=13706 RepID=A0A1X2H9X1_SYNRA|nr:Scramblase-domain-containing protein [Syncephalastrum racemosum]
MHRSQTLVRRVPPQWHLLHQRSNQPRLFLGRSVVRPFQRPTNYSNYSSLRRPRQTGPRGRILNHVENLRPARPVQAAQAAAPAQQLVETVDDTVEIPEPEAGAVVRPDNIGAPVLSHSALVIGREFEMMNIFLGFEQANRYKIMDPNGNYVGFIAEEEGFAKSVSRQFLKTHRPFKATILNNEGQVVFKIERPFAFINSRIFIYTADDELVGEVQQRWHLLRRKYDLFVGTQQFANVDTPFLGWDFVLQDEQGGPIGTVNRNFSGFAREIFTDTGQYVLRMDAAEGHTRALTLDERAVTLACAISIDFDYFSRHSQHGGGFMPFPFFGFGGSGAEEGSGNDSEGPSDGPSAPPPPPQPEQPSSGWGDDGWMSDEEAGVSKPLDDLQGFLGGIFGDDD